MASRITGILSIERDELSKVSILILQSVFLGIFAGAFDVGAQSIFLEAFDAALIPKAFAISGATGIIITSFYSFLQARIRFSVFAILNLLFIAICTTGLRLVFEITGDERLIFAMFVLMGPLTIITFLGFWGTVSRLFTLRQGKRLFGMIDTGQIAGMILSFYAFPFLISYNFKVLNSLYISAGSIVLALIIQIFISARYRFSLPVKPSQYTEKRKNRFLDLFRSRYTRLMVLFVALSVFAAFFIHFSFLSVTEENYPEAEGLASFLGVFMGTLMIFTLFVKTFVYGRLMKTYGIKLALLISPVILGIFTALALMVGNRYGFTAGSAGFTMFFLLIVSAKLFSKSLKDSIEVPSSKILYQTLDSDIRYDVQARIDGTINEIAAFSAGLLMVGLAFTKINPLYFSYVLFGIIVIWAISGYALYKAYRLSLQYSLRKFLDTAVNEHQKKSVTSGSPEIMNESDRLEKVLNYVPQTWNGFITTNIEKLLNSDRKKIQEITIKWINNLNLTESQNYLIAKEKNVSSPEKNSIRKLINRFNLRKSEINPELIHTLIRSEDPEERMTAVAAILKDPSSVSPLHLLPLMRDTDDRVKASSIRAAGKLNFYELAPHLIDLLEDKTCYPFAYGALARMGENVTEKLEQGFYRTGISEKQMIRLLRLITLSGHPQTGTILMNMLETSGLTIKTEILKNLLHINFASGPAEEIRLFNVLVEICSITAWNIAAQYSIKEHGLGDELYQAFDEELTGNYDVIFDILSIVYDVQLIYHIRKNLESGTSEGIGFAIELLDMFVDENVKSYLFPLLEDSSVQSKVQRLQSEFPIEIYKAVDLINNILNRDYNKISAYTRLLAIKSIEKIEGYSIGNELIAQLFNPDDDIAFAAAAQLISIEFDTFEQVSERIPRKRYDKMLEYAASLQEGKIKGLYERFRVLREKSVLGVISDISLFTLARDFKAVYLNPGEQIMEISALNNELLMFLYKGTLISMKAIPEIRIKEGFFFRQKDFYEQYGDKAKLIAEKDTVLLVIEEGILKEHIFDDEFKYIHILDLIEDINKISYSAEEGPNK